MQWFRLHHKLLNDPVVQCLTDYQFKIYINLLCHASMINKGGYLGTISETSFALRETKENVSSCFTAFQGVGLIVSNSVSDVTAGETFQIPQWKKLQYKSDTSTNRVKKFRENKKRSKIVTKSVTVTAPEAETDTEQIQNNNTSTEPTSESIDSCPHQKIINTYHEKLPTLRKVKVWSDQRKKLLRSRWRESGKHQSIEFWEGLFDYVSQSPFLTGNVNDFQCDLEWIVRPSNFVKIIEGKYHE